MKRYNFIINIMFWVLLILFFSGIGWSYANYGNEFIKFFTDPQDMPASEKVIIKKEPVIINQKEKEIIEWFYFVATGYSANDPVQGTDDKTATGKTVYEGVIAVDPKIIPLGSEVEIKGIGKFIAEDTGGKIKGNRVDIYFNEKEDAKDFGKKGIWLRVINQPQEIASETLINQ